MALCRKFMWLRILCWEILIFARVRMVLTACQYAPDQFLVTPQNSIAHEGSWTNFSCSPRDFNQDSDTITWRVAPTTEQKDPIQSDDMSGTVTSTLMIKVIGRADYSIICSVEKITNQHSICYSSRSKLTVHYFPDESELKCCPNESTDVREGELLQVNCNVTRSKPAVDLNWSFDDGGPPLPTLMPDNDGRVRYLTHIMPITRGMHGKTITCVVTSDLAFKGRAMNCTIGPIKVLIPPQVTVHPGSIVVQDNQQATLFCEAHGYPNTFNFSWTCSPSEFVYGCNTTSQIANISLQCNQSQTSCRNAKNISVSCTASNFVGNVTNSSQIFIEREYYTELGNTNDTPENCGRGIFLNMSSHITFINQQRQIKVYCTILQTQNNSAEVLWYFDRSQLHSTSQRFVLEELPPSTFSLHILNLSHSDLGKAVECKIASCKTVQRSSLLLSFNLDQGQFQEPINPFGTSQQSQLLWWQMVMIASAGVVAAIVLIACVVALLVTFIQRQLHPINQITSKTFNHDHRGLDQSSMSSKDNSFIDPTYEVPTIPFDKTVTDEYPEETPYYGLTHTYASDIAPTSVNSSPSKRSSWTTSSDTSKGSTSTPPTENQVHLDTSVTSESPYFNESVILMHTFKRQKSATKSLNRQKGDMNINEKPMPSVP